MVMTVVEEARETLAKALDWTVKNASRIVIRSDSVQFPIIPEEKLANLRVVARLEKETENNPTLIAADAVPSNGLHNDTNANQQTPRRPINIQHWVGCCCPTWTI